MNQRLPARVSSPFKVNRMKLCAMLTLLASIVATTSPVAQASEEIIIKALVDGPSDLIITTNGFQWRNGANAKVGRHEGQNQPTYINDHAWYPKWEKDQEERGVDSSDTFIFPVKALNLDFELLAVGDHPDAQTIEPRTAPTVTYGQNSIIISIPDPEASSRWYVFALVGRTAE